MGLTEEINSLKEQINKLEEMDKVKTKKFKFPFGKKITSKQKASNFVTVLVINENGTYKFEKYKIEDQTILHRKIPRLASSGYVMFDKKGNPLIILPNWSVEPFNPISSYKKSLEDGTNTIGYRLLMDRMQREQTTQKPKMSGMLKWIIGIGLAGIIIYALLTGGG